MPTPGAVVANKTGSLADDDHFFLFRMDTDDAHRIHEYKDLVLELLASTTVNCVQQSESRFSDSDIASPEIAAFEDRPK